MNHFIVDIPGRSYMCDCVSIDWDGLALSIVLASGNVNKFPIVNHRKEVDQLFENVTCILRKARLTPAVIEINDDILN